MHFYKPDEHSHNDNQPFSPPFSGGAFNALLLKASPKLLAIGDELNRSAYVSGADGNDMEHPLSLLAGLNGITLPEMNEREAAYPIRGLEHQYLNNLYFSMQQGNPAVSEAMPALLQKNRELLCEEYRQALKPFSKLADNHYAERMVEHVEYHFRKAINKEFAMGYGEENLRPGKDLGDKNYWAKRLPNSPLTDPPRSR